MLPVITYPDQKCLAFKALEENNRHYIVSGLLIKNLDLEATYSQPNLVENETLLHAAIRLGRSELLSEIVNSPYFESHARILNLYAVYYCGIDRTPVPYTPQELAAALKHQDCIAVLDKYQNRLSEEALVAVPDLSRKPCLA